MALKIKPDALAQEVMKALDEFKDITTDALKEAVKETGDETADDIRNTAPKDTGAYGKSWKAKITRESSSAIGVTVHSRNRYQLAHLLEHGHAKRGGGRVAPRPHLEAAEQKAESMLTQKIERKLKNG